MKNLSYQAYLNQYMDYDGELWLELDRESKDSTAGLRVQAGNLLGHFQQAAWDSAVLGIPVHKVTEVFVGAHPTSEEIAEFAQNLDDTIRKEAAVFATVRLGFGLFSLVTALEERGWRVGDVLNIYHQETNANATGERIEDADLREPPWSEVEAAFPDLARYFSHSRIVRDSRIPAASATKFFATLLRGIYQRPTSTKVGLYRGGELAGLAVGDSEEGVAGRVPGGLGYLWLIAIRPDWSGLGLSRPLLRGFLGQMAGRCRHVEVGTQVDNLRANRLYHRSGLNLVSNAITLHRWFVR